MDRSKVVIAEVLRPRGNRGQVIAKPHSDVPGRLQQLKQVQARLANGDDVPVEIAEASVQAGFWVLKFAGIDSIPAAERFRGADLWIAAELRGTLPQGEFFESDLIGCSVVDTRTGAILGTVERCHAYGGAPLIQTTIAGREVLIPFVPEICSDVDLTARAIKVALPGGLLDL